MWYISQPAKCGPLMSHFSRFPSDARTNAPLRVPTNTRTLLNWPLLPVHWAQLQQDIALTDGCECGRSGSGTFGSLPTYNHADGYLSSISCDGPPGPLPPYSRRQCFRARSGTKPAILPGSAWISTGLRRPY